MDETKPLELLQLQIWIFQSDLVTQTEYQKISFKFTRCELSNSCFVLDDRTLDEEMNAEICIYIEFFAEEMNRHDF